MKTKTLFYFCASYGAALEMRGRHSQCSQGMCSLEDISQRTSTQVQMLVPKSLFFSKSESGCNIREREHPKEHDLICLRRPPKNVQDCRRMDDLPSAAHMQHTSNSAAAGWLCFHNAAGLVPLLKAQVSPSFSHPSKTKSLPAVQQTICGGKIYFSQGPGKKQASCRGICWSLSAVILFDFVFAGTFFWRVASELFAWGAVQVKLDSLPSVCVLLLLLLLLSVVVVVLCNKANLLKNTMSHTTRREEGKQTRSSVQETGVKLSF